MSFVKPPDSEGWNMNSTTHIDFGVTGSALHVSQVTALLNLTPTSAFDPNERYAGKVRVGGTIVSVEKNRPPFGVRHYSTENKIESQSVEDHARFLLNELRPAKHGIEKLLQSSEFDLRLSIWYVGPNGFDLSSETLGQLADICTNLTVRCFATDEASTG